MTLGRPVARVNFEDGRSAIATVHHTIVAVVGEAPALSHSQVVNNIMRLLIVQVVRCRATETLLSRWPLQTPLKNMILRIRQLINGVADLRAAFGKVARAQWLVNFDVE